jgi:hypothetical protein
MVRSERRGVCGRPEQVAVRCRIVAGRVRCRGEGARSAAGVGTGTVRHCGRRSPAPAGAASDRGMASVSAGRVYCISLG